MTESYLDASGLQYAWNSSSIKLAEACLRKYQYVMMDGWSSPETSVHLIFGAHYATALEHFHRLRGAGHSFDEALASVVIEALVNTWEHDRDDEGNRIPGTGQEWESHHNLKTRGTLIRSIIWYLDHFSDDPAQTVMLADGAPAVEFTFRLPVDNGLLFTGHMDRLVDYADKIYVQDQKTTGSTISAYFFDGFKPDTQMSMYTFAGKSIYNLPVNGVMVDGAQIAVGFTRFERGFTFRTESELNEWYDTTMYHIEAAREATAAGYFPMNAASCGNYGGCPFRKVCSRDPSIRENFLRGNFTKSAPMSPLSIR